MPANITLNGFSEFADKCKNFTAEMLEEADLEVEDSAKQWEGLAKRDAPRDHGLLVSGIRIHKLAQAEWEVTSNASYSPYIEWGTRTKVSVPTDLQAYAGQFRGKGQGGGTGFFNMILAWVKRKGIGLDNLKATNEARQRFGQKRVTKADRYEAVARRIAYTIMKKGINPHPFFFIQQPIVEAEFIKHMQQVLNDEFNA